MHQVLPVSTFRIRDQQDLVLSQPFLQFLHALPLEYNYALYRDIFQRFGTHYYSSGALGGLYDLLYQYSREELKSSGTAEQYGWGLGCYGLQSLPKIVQEQEGFCILETSYRSDGMSYIMHSVGSSNNGAMFHLIIAYFSS